MIRQLIKRGFASRLYSWGANYNNVGSGIKSISGANMPNPVKLESIGDIKKVICSFSESLVLTSDGKLHSWGYDGLLPETSYIPGQITTTNNLNFTDVDVGATHFIGTTKEGQVYEIWNTELNHIQLPGKARLVACGDDASFAVVKGENGRDKIYAWSSANGPRNGAIFCVDYRLPRPVSEFVQANYWLEQLQTNVKKIKVVQSSVVVLLENGELLTWGDNTSGNLGVYRSELALLENEVYQPTRINHESNIHDKIVDFDLSDNILVALTENNHAYFCGLEGVFTLKPIPFFPGQKIVKVGAEHNKYYLFSSNGKVFSNKSFDEEQYIKYYGEFGLYEVDRRYFNGAEIDHISGKYDNAVAVCK
jgi:alpha-tubulin suppressor-like RCC1 family protein